MTNFATASSIINVVGFIASLYTAFLFVRIIRIRQSSKVWINYCFAVVIITIGIECLMKAFAPATRVQLAQIVSQMFIALSIVLAALLIRPLYTRLRNHSGYDNLKENNQQLAYSQNLLERFINEIPAVAYVVDAKDHLLFGNKRLFQEQSVTPPTDVLAREKRHWLPTSAARAVGRQHEKVRSTGLSRDYVGELVRGGKTSTWLLHNFPVNGPSGEQLVGGVAIDITELLHLRSMDSLLASIVDLTSDAIYTVNDTGSITSWNPGAESILGYHSHEIIGLPVAVLASKDHDQNIDNVMERLEAGEVLTDCDFAHICKNGATKHLLLSATKLKSNKADGARYAFYARDITSERLASLEVRKLNTELDMRIRQLSAANDELQKACDQALESSNLKTAFITSITHEIRTPLSGILGMGELILKEPLNRDAKDIMITINNSAVSLLTIVNDILNLSQLEEGTVSLERKPFSPTSIIEDCLKLVSSEVTSKRLKLVLAVGNSIPDRVYGDPARVRQILLNLLGNAIKFTETGVISVECRLLEEGERFATLYFSVSDTGIGIRREDRHLLFTPFSRIEKSTRGIKGTGLGLTISKQFIDLMNGQIDFESVEGQGSKFWFSIPLEKASKLSGGEVNEEEEECRPVPTLSQQASGLTSVRVLSVEDNPLLSQLTMKQLSNIGVQADSATNGLEALDKLLEDSFDVVLLDINLPDINGYEVTRIIRERERTGNRKRHIIIAVTAGVMADDREKALAIGMDDYMSKPVNVSQLRDRLMRWTQNTRSQNLSELETIIETRHNKEKLM